MKKFYLLSLLCAFIINLSAQNKFEGIFLYEKFVPGKVTYKTGAEKDALLNYNKIDEKMYFILQDADSTILELTMTSFISEIKIGNRTFEHVKEGQFYEKIDVPEGAFYIRWKSTFASGGRDIGRGAISTTGAVDNAANAFGHSMTSKLQSTETFTTNSHDSYYLKVKDNFKRFTSFNSLAKEFKKNEKGIKNYVKEENLDFKDLDDVKKAVAYCFQNSKQ